MWNITISKRPSFFPHTWFAKNGTLRMFALYKNRNNSKYSPQRLNNKLAVTLLSEGQRRQVLPLLPQGAQLEFFSGNIHTFIRRSGLGLGVSALISKFTIGTFLIPLSLTFPMWAAALKAMKQNCAPIFLNYTGIWHCHVLELFGTEATRTSNVPDVFHSLSKPKKKSYERLLNLVVGDYSGAEIIVIVPWRLEYLRLKIGEPAELLIVSNTQTMDSFKALSEVYMPESGLWVAEYPFLQRCKFMELSSTCNR